MFRLFWNLLLFTGMAYAAGFVWFVLFPVVNTNREVPPTEAVVVFTGGENRVVAGLQLLQQSKGKYLFISGVDRKATLTDIIHAARLTADQVPCCVELGRTAADTIGNARETKEWLQGKNINEFILVTSSFHMRRSLMELKIIAPELAVHPYPIAPDQPRDWKNWQNTYVWKFHINEYNKYIFALLRFVAR